MAATEKLLKASGVLYEDRRNFYIDPQVTKELWTDVAPFTTMISNQEMRNVPDPVFKMFEHRNPWVKQSFNINEADTLSADGTESPASTDYSDVDGIQGLSSPADSSWIGLIVEIRSSGVKKATAIISAVDSGDVKFKAISTDCGSD